MPLPFPYTMRDTEPLVLKLGPPIRGPLPPTQADYDPWFTVEKTGAKGGFLFSPGSVLGDFVKASLAEFFDVRLGKPAVEDSRTLEEIERPSSKFIVGREVWAWCACARSPEARRMHSGGYEFPYKGKILSYNVVNRTCCIKFCGGTTIVPCDKIEFNDPRKK